MRKFWWKGEPLIVGSLHWEVINNDLKNNIMSAFNQYKATTTIDEAVAIAHKQGLTVRVELVPKKKD